MDTRRALLVDAFTTSPLEGNAAGLILDAEGLSSRQMQTIATELGASETAFLSPSTTADRQIRFFTPTQEVDLCGHATIASHAVLHQEGLIETGSHSVETNVGLVDVEIGEDDTVWMSQQDPAVTVIDADLSRFATALGVAQSTLVDIGADAPVARATTGLPWLMVPVNFLEHVGTADPDMSAIEALSDEYDVAGVYAFSFDTVEAASTLHARAFAPAAGVPEDPVTGTASGACAAYLREINAFDGAFPDEMRFEQGHFLQRDGHVRVRVGDTIRVGGTAVISLDGSVTIPERDPDDIVEA